MQKIIDSFRRNPTLANEMRLRNYVSKHHMALALLSQEDYEFLKYLKIIK